MTDHLIHIIDGEGSTHTLPAEEGSTLGDVVAAAGLPLEQPCGGRGTCGKCRVLVDGVLDEPGETELKLLTSTELNAGFRLACRTQVVGSARVTLTPIVVYSNKIFRACDDARLDDVPLGLAVDLGSTTVAAYLTRLDNGKVCAGAASLNRQTIFGADVISRLAVALSGPQGTARLSALAAMSINEAIEALGLVESEIDRIEKITIVGNCAMHHLLLSVAVDGLAAIPFQPTLKSIPTMLASDMHLAIRPDTPVWIPPLIGGFVGSDALACLLNYGFDRAPKPMAAIDLGTNGEVMVTDGKQILVASTAAGPAFEGVNIACGSRAVDGAVVGVSIDGSDSSFDLATIANQPPVGLTGAGLIQLVSVLREQDVIDASGRMAANHSRYGNSITQDSRGARRFNLLTVNDSDNIFLTQKDVRELQKAKGAMAAATLTLMKRLDLEPSDLDRMILTGSFGSQLDVNAILNLGMIPAVDPSIVETPANGAGLGAALMLQADEFARAESIAQRAIQVDLDVEAGFNQRYLDSLALQPIG